MSLRNLLPVLFLLIATASAKADHPSNSYEWMWRTNGLGWGEGYHAYNGCCKQGVLPRSHVPTGYHYQGNVHAGTFGYGYGYAPSYHSPAPQSYPMPRPPQPPRERLPAPMMNHP